MADPKLYAHLSDLYNFLVEESNDGENWEGSQAQTFAKMNLSSAYNPILYRGLRELGCIEMIERGHGPMPTKLRLLKPPQIEEFDEWREGERALTRRASLSTIEQDVRVLERRLPQGVDLPSWILGIENRLTAIEQRLGEMNGAKTKGNT